MTSTVTKHIRKRLLERVGIPTGPDRPTNVNLSIQEILDIQINWNFFAEMANARVLGYFRYGPKSEQTVNYNYIEEAKTKIQLYVDTGNFDYLRDAANYLMMERTDPWIKGAHLEVVDDKVHARELKVKE